MGMIEALLRDDRGATAVEYGLIVSLIAVAIIGTLGRLGESLVAIFEDIAMDIATAVGF